ncbi:metallophosphoesterase domain-containing protein [Aspergillus sclerotialis]|uniref:Metallophosphoesterase domain-containing protein n=1 Tax=Aspergillus sclerotialis TaxID=2070753 RepID=A0A3A2Z5Y9_9EURO|nr:metallophosphoesterase domain-containing protein [Aspergillus sclerotialis]
MGLPASVKTRFLILSDTHGMRFRPDSNPSQQVDVVIHCGDLTTESKLAEYRSTIQLLNGLNAPLKLVIAGNHDFTLDTPVYRQKLSEASRFIDPALIIKEYGDYGEAKKLFDEAREAGIYLLDEGTHHFVLDNGASLTVYASPYTPSVGDWGFQYHPKQPHDFAMGAVDVAITHGPPLGVLDHTLSGVRAGSEDLFAAVARARPRIHCFGHIHEGWGAKLVTWKKNVSESPSHFSDIDHGKSALVENLASLDRKMPKPTGEKYYATSHCAGDKNPAVPGNQTLFVNAALRDTSYNPIQLPWLVDVELERAQ